MIDAANKHIAEEIVRLYHPKFEPTYVSKGSGKEHKRDILVNALHDWVVIQVPISKSFTSKMDISIGIDFLLYPGDEFPKNGLLAGELYGPGWKLDTFEKIHKNSAFKAWRFSDDSKYLESAECLEKYGTMTPLEVNPDVNEILKKHNVPRPTAQEMFDYYYQD